MKPKVLEYKETCGACPSQWKGKLEDGKFIYIRYRWSTLEVGIGKDMAEAVRSREVFERTPGDGLLGVMEDVTMRERLTAHGFDMTEAKEVH